MNKRILSFIFLILLVSSGFSAEIDNEISIVGFDATLNCVAFYKTEINTGKGDRKISFLVYNFVNCKNIESTKAKYMADYYQGPGGTIDDWSDEKYSVSAYYKFNKQSIDEICSKYDFKTLNAIPGNFQSKTLILQRTNIDGLRENVDYCVNFTIGSSEIKINQHENSVCYIKDVSIKNIWSFNNKYVVLLKKSHRGFEGDDFCDYEFVMIH